MIQQKRPKKTRRTNDCTGRQHRYKENSTPHTSLLSHTYSHTLHTLGAIGQGRFEQTEEEEERKKKYYGFAASAATVEELKLAKTGIQPDSTKAVVCSKRVWRPQVKYEYHEVPT
jgi:hypothetical protein